PAKFAIVHATHASVLTVKLAASPLEVSGLKALQVTKLRIEARELSFYDRVARHMPTDQSGVYIDSVESGGPGGLAHIKSGDIVLSLDEHATPDLEAFSAALELALKSHSQAIPIRVVRGAEVRLLFLDRSWLQDKTP
ncbi:MAG: PDZ domain-containing protein, partial [Lysobacteraceae bacterium]